MITKSLLTHPLECLLVRVVTAQANLDKVLARHQPFFDQAVNGHSVADQMSHHVFSGVIVSVKMNNTNIALAIDIG